MGTSFLDLSFHIFQFCPKKIPSVRHLWRSTLSEWYPIFVQEKSLFSLFLNWMITPITHRHVISYLLLPLINRPKNTPLRNVRWYFWETKLEPTQLKFRSIYKGRSSNTTRFVFFNKNCFFQQELFFRQDLSFSTRFVFFNKYCLFQHAVKKQVLSKKTRFVENRCWKRQILSKKTNLVEKDKSCQKRPILSC